MCILIGSDVWSTQSLPHSTVCTVFFAFWKQCASQSSRFRRFQCFTHRNRINSMFACGLLARRKVNAASRKTNNLNFKTTDTLIQVILRKRHCDTLHSCFCLGSSWEFIQRNRETKIILREPKNKLLKELKECYTDRSNGVCQKVNDMLPSLPHYLYDSRIKSTI